MGSKESSAGLERMLPNSREAEISVLGSIVRENDVLADVLQIVRGADEFYHHAHRIIFATILALYQSGKPIDLVTLGQSLTDAKKIEDVGGYDALAKLWDAAPTAANAIYYADIVHEKYVLREVICTGTDMLRNAYDQSGRASDLLEQAEKAIFKIGMESELGGTATVAEIMPRIYDAIDSGEAAPGVGMGLIDLDQIIRLRPGEVTVMAARPSVGKTALAITAAISVAQNDNIASLFCSLEMSQQELVERMLCQVGNINSYRLRHRKLSPEELDQVIEAGPPMRALAIHIDDKPGQSMLQISANARRLRLRNQIGLVIIDYIQLVDPENRKDPRQEQVASISRRIKLLAKELAVPVLALSQLNRGVEGRSEGPRLSDLRESGAIEQDADNVILLHRPNDDDRSLIEAHVAKQRNGPTGNAVLFFRQEMMRFENYNAEPPL